MKINFKLWNYDKTHLIAGRWVWLTNFEAQKQSLYRKSVKEFKERYGIKDVRFKIYNRAYIPNGEGKLIPGYKSLLLYRVNKKIIDLSPFWKIYYENEKRCLKNAYIPYYK